MLDKDQRFKEKTKLNKILQLFYKYAYAETLAIVSLLLLIGYYINPKDICLLNANLPYVIIILTIVTLFHGFESGVLALTVISLTMWFFYPTFHYISFLTFLLMVLLLSQFHYFWISQLKKAKVVATYKSQKLSELSRAFYSLKISHDQLEKNYVVKPMSIRNSVNYILSINEKIANNKNETEKQKAFHANLLQLLEKSFNLKVGHVIYFQDNAQGDDVIEENLEIVTIGTDDIKEVKEILNDYIIDRSIARKSPVFVSDENGNPSAINEQQSKYLASIPALVNNNIASILVIEKMPFMFFNRESLTSITILHEYFALETSKSVKLSNFHQINIIDDKEFQFELFRMKNFYLQYKIHSALLVLRTPSELRATRLMNRLEKLLRSLDMSHLAHYNNKYFITILLPMYDKTAAVGLVNRLHTILEDENDQKFDHMTFDMGETKLLEKYYRDNYED